MIFNKFAAYIHKCEQKNTRFANFQILVLGLGYLIFFFSVCLVSIVVPAVFIYFLVFKFSEIDIKLAIAGFYFIAGWLYTFGRTSTLTELIYLDLNFRYKAYVPPYYQRQGFSYISYLFSSYALIWPIQILKDLDRASNVFTTRSQKLQDEFLRNDLLKDIEGGSTLEEACTKNNTSIAHGVFLLKELCYDHNSKTELRLPAKLPLNKTEKLDNELIRLFEERGF